MPASLGQYRRRLSGVIGLRPELGTDGPDYYRFNTAEFGRIACPHKTHFLARSRIVADTYRSSDSTWPYPLGVAGIAGLLLYNGVMRLFSGVLQLYWPPVRSPWGLGISGIYIVLGIGLLKMLDWARLATIMIEVLSLVYVGVDLVRGFRHWHLVVFLAVFLGFLFRALIAGYLLSPNIRLAYTRPVRDASALAEKT